MEASSILQKLRTHIEVEVQLTDVEFALVQSCFTIRHFSRRYVVFREGDYVNHLYFIASGLTKMMYTDDAGGQRIVSFALEDWWETDSQAFFTHSPATFSLHCLEDTTAYLLSADKYKYLLREVPQISYSFLHKTTRAFIASQQRVLQLMTATARQRYEQLVQRQPALLKRVSKTELAAYLGVSRETLSRLYRSG